MNDEMLGISALDPRVAATDKFIKDKNIPPDQVPAFILSLGYDPKLAGLVMRFRKLKQAAENQKNAQGAQTTAGQDINAAYNNMKQQEVAQKVEEATRARQRMAGIPTIPAPTMDRAQFADGGLVAFAGDQGSFVQSSGPNYHDMYARLAEMPEAGPQIISQALTPEDAASIYAVALSRGDEKTADRLRPYLLRSGFGPQMGEWFSKTREGLGTMSQLRDQQAREAQQKKQAEKEAARQAGISAQIESLRTGAKRTTPAAPAAEASAAAAAPAKEKADEYSVVRPAAKEEKFTPTSIPAAKAESVGDIASFEKQLADIAKARGWGKAREEYGKYLMQQQEEAKKQGGVDRNLALAQAGFAAMQAAAQPGGTFGGAFGAFGNKYAADLMALNRQQKMLDREMRESQFKLSQADELEAQGRLRDAMAMRKDEQARAERIAEHRDEMNVRRATLASEERRFRVQQDNALAIANARTAATSREALARLQTARVNATKNLNTDTEYQDAVNVLRTSKDKDERKRAKQIMDARREEYLGGLEDAIKDQMRGIDGFGSLEQE